MVEVPEQVAMTKDWKTRLIHTDAKVPEGFESLASPVYRGSTVVFPDTSSTHTVWNQEELGYAYGLHGTPTTLELAARIAELEGGTRTLLTPSGMAAIGVVDLAFLSAGSHVLIPENVYSPNRVLAVKMLQRFGIESSFYPPEIGGGIVEHFRSNTHLVWTESPGSITMEVQDVPSICAAARERSIPVALDNTWSAGVLFSAFDHGVDVTVQAATKYIGGHSDLLMGSVTVRDHAHLERLGEVRARLGLAVSPDDCSLALRGLATMAVRLKHVEQSALEIARWLAGRPEVQTVLHPALESCPGNDLWKRDFTGSSGLFSLVMKPEFSGVQVRAFVDALELFKIGYSWGGVASLAVPYDTRRVRSRTDYGDRIVRLNIGLESTADLIADLDRGLRAMRG
jgi:cystathionine beta-lyase